MGEKISLVQKAYASTVEKVNVALKECYNNGLLGVGMDAASASLNIKLSIK